MDSQGISQRALPRPRTGEGAGLRRARWAVSAILLVGFLVVSSVIMLTPVAWMIGGAMKSNREVMTIPIQWLPSQFRLVQNVRDMLERVPYARYYANSVVVAVLATAGTVFFSSMIGYGLAKFDFPGKKIFFAFILATMMVPGQLTLIGLYVVVKNLGWLNSYQGLIVPQMSGAFGIFLMRQSLLAIPEELLDAARIDGANEFAIFWQVVLPLIKPAIAALAILSGTGHWDRFLWPLISITDKMRYTLPVGLRYFLSDYGGSYYAELMAGSTLALIPVLFLFLAFQRQFIRGVISSGLKQ